MHRKSIKKIHQKKSIKKNLHVNNNHLYLYDYYNNNVNLHEFTVTNVGDF